MLMMRRCIKMKPVKPLLSLLLLLVIPCVFIHHIYNVVIFIHIDVIVSLVKQVLKSDCS